MILPAVFFTWCCCLKAPKAEGCGTYLFQGEICKKAQYYCSTGCHRKTLFEVIVAEEGSSLKVKTKMQTVDAAGKKHLVISQSIRLQ